MSTVAGLSWFAGLAGRRRRFRPLLGPLARRQVLVEPAGDPVQALYPAVGAPASREVMRLAREADQLDLLAEKPHRPEKLFSLRDRTAEIHLPVRQKQRCADESDVPDRRVLPELLRI